MDRLFKWASTYKLAKNGNEKADRQQVPSGTYMKTVMLDQKSMKKKTCETD